MSFAERLKTTRERLGLSQAEAAALLECGKRTLEHWEAGDRVPLAITQEGALERLRATKRSRKIRRGWLEKVLKINRSGIMAAESDVPSGLTSTRPNTGTER